MAIKEAKDFFGANLGGESFVPSVETSRNGNGNCSPETVLFVRAPRYEQDPNFIGEVDKLVGGYVEGLESQRVFLSGRGTRDGLTIAGERNVYRMRLAEFQLKARDLVVGGVVGDIRRRGIDVIGRLVDVVWQAEDRMGSVSGDEVSMLGGRAYFICVGAKEVLNIAVDEIRRQGRPLNESLVTRLSRGIMGLDDISRDELSQMMGEFVESPPVR
ncbi:hypothetical protein C4577_02725 [Candidatus Parcubacteria bacterium]|nr:MAG: hypothetical protein C4577_02725 [Candidatus Parcubacteria bacterium]